MKGISVWQPWASLIACGAKKVETRGWATPYRGELAIHASKRWTAAEREAADQLVALARFELDNRDLLAGELPRGAVVAIARLVDVRLMDQALIDQQTSLELELGGWSPGRYAWVLKDVQPLAVPFYMRGAQGIFEVGPAVRR